RLVTPGATGRLSPEALRRLRRVVEPLSRKGVDTHQAAATVEAALALLREEGLPFDPIDAGDLQEEVPAFLHSLTQVVDGILSSTEAAMSVDLESALARSRRSIHQRLSEFHQRYAYHFTGGWREL